MTSTNIVFTHRPHHHHSVQPATGAGWRSQAAYVARHGRCLSDRQFGTDLLIGRSAPTWVECHRLAIALSECR
jgi:hypothetical protein